MVPGECADGRGPGAPQQISARLRLDFPEDATERISQEAIYESLFIQGRGAARDTNWPPA